MGSKFQEKGGDLKPFTQSATGNITMDLATTDSGCPPLATDLETAIQPQESLLLDHSDASDKENSLDSSSLLESSLRSSRSTSGCVIPADTMKSITGNNNHPPVVDNNAGIAMVSSRPVVTEDGETFNLVPLDDETPLFVTCGPNKAVLYLERLDKGSKGASILFENWWLTPNEFQKVSGRGTAKDWKRSIKHHGRSLKLLMAKNMLFLNPPQCKCEYCISDAEVEGDNKGIIKQEEGEAIGITPAQRQHEVTSTEVGTDTPARVAIAVGIDKPGESFSICQDIQVPPEPSFQQEVMKGKDERDTHHAKSRAGDSPTNPLPPRQTTAPTRTHLKTESHTKSSTNSDVENNTNKSQTACELDNGGGRKVPGLIIDADAHVQKSPAPSHTTTLLATTTAPDEFLQNGAQRGGNHPLGIGGSDASIKHSSSELNAASKEEDWASLKAGNPPPPNKGCARHQKSGRKTKSKPMCIRRKSSSCNESSQTTPVLMAVNECASSVDTITSTISTMDDDTGSSGSGRDAVGDTKTQSENSLMSDNTTTAYKKTKGSSCVEYFSPSLFHQSPPPAASVAGVTEVDGEIKQGCHLLSDGVMESTNYSQATIITPLAQHDRGGGVHHHKLGKEIRSQLKMKGSSNTSTRTIGDVHMFTTETHSSNMFGNDEDGYYKNDGLSIESLVAKQQTINTFAKNTPQPEHSSPSQSTAAQQKQHHHGNQDCNHSAGDFLLSTLSSAADGYGVGEAHTHQTQCQSPRAPVKLPPCVTPPQNHSSIVDVASPKAATTASTTNGAEFFPARTTQAVVALDNVNHRGNMSAVPALLLAGEREENLTKVETEENENAAMSPKKEARLITIIEELKHYKKCLEVQIQEQKKSSTSPSSIGKPSSPEGHQPPCPISCSPTVALSSPQAMVIPTPNTSALGLIQSPFSSPTLTSSASNGPRISSGRSSRVSSPGLKEGTVSDPTCHATGTVHWGMPKGHSPLHSSPTSTVMISTHYHNKGSKSSGHHSMSEGSRTPPHGNKHCKNGLKANGIYSAAKELARNLNCQSAKKTARSNSVASPMFKALVANSNNNNNMPVPPIDMNAYFSYLSECLKRGQMPNMYGYHNSNVTLSKSSSGDESPVVINSRTSIPRSVVPQKRSHSHEPHFDDVGALDLSVKRPRVYEAMAGYTRQSSEPITLDEYGALDLSKK